MNRLLGPSILLPIRDEFSKITIITSVRNQRIISSPVENLGIHIVRFYFYFATHEKKLSPNSIFRGQSLWGQPGFSPFTTWGQNEGIDMKDSRKTSHRSSSR